MPVFVIAGWADGYRNTPATVAASATAPVKAMTGPWVHKYPHFAWPRPRADFIGTAIAWWKRWLAGKATEVEAWPAYRAYICEGSRPGGWRADEPGRWVGLDDWPAAAVRETRLTLGAHGHLGGAAPEERLIASPQHCGVMGGEYVALAPDADLPGDQTPDDAVSACWETEPPEASLDILGRPEFRVSLSIDQPQGNLIARLVDVRPDGVANLIACGVLNLCHRDSSAAPEAIVPGDFLRRHADARRDRLPPGAGPPAAVGALHRLLAAGAAGAAPGDGDAQSRGRGGAGAADPRRGLRKRRRRRRRTPTRCRSIQSAPGATAAAMWSATCRPGGCAM